jgi:hypothetical protein
MTYACWLVAGCGSLWFGLTLLRDVLAVQRVQDEERGRDA